MNYANTNGVIFPTVQQNWKETLLKYVVEQYVWFHNDLLKKAEDSSCQIP